jgi:hypothetical protein
MQTTPWSIDDAPHSAAFAATQSRIPSLAPARAAAAVCFGLAVLLVGCDVPAPARASDAAAEAGSHAGSVARAAESEFESIRIATERCRDVDGAVVEGYIRDPADVCFVPAMDGQPPQLGGMGVHCFWPDRIEPWTGDAA